jgi:hypothetical protein
MSEQGPEATAEITANAEVIPAAQVEAEKAEAEEKGGEAE